MLIFVEGILSGGNLIGALTRYALQKKLIKIAFKIMMLKLSIHAF
jgi:hypothetical protein